VRVTRYHWATALAALTAITLTLAWLAPSRNYDEDGLDELQLIEAARPTVVAKHALVEPAAWLIMQGLRAADYHGLALRPVQLWNALWLALALAAALLWLRRAGVGLALALAAWGVLSGCYASLHLTQDPYALYWPPTLALLTGALWLTAPARAAGERLWRRWTAVLALAGALPLVNAMLLLGAPLLAWRWYQRETGARRVARLARACGLLLLPATTLAATLVALHWLQGQAVGPAGPFGHWTSDTWREGWQGLTGALVPRREGYTLLGAVRGAGSLAASATSLATLLTGGAATALGARLARRGQWRRAVPVGATAAVVAAAILWWDPAQVQFWLLPGWLALLGGLEALAPAAPPPASTATRRSRHLGVTLLLASAAAALWTANLAGYVVPAATRFNTRRLAAERLAAAFAPADLLLVQRPYQDLYVDYFGRRQTISMLGVALSPVAGHTTREKLRAILEYVRQRGGAVYLELPPPGAPWPRWPQEKRAGVDFLPADYARLRLGPTITVEHRAFRQLLEAPE
jgi:hypothetical protein